MKKKLCVLFVIVALFGFAGTAFAHGHYGHGGGNGTRDNGGHVWRHR